MSKGRQANIYFRFCSVQSLPKDQKDLEYFVAIDSSTYPCELLVLIFTSQLTRRPELIM